MIRAHLPTTLLFGTLASVLALANGSVITLSAAAESNLPSIRVADAYVRPSADGAQWKIGTDAVEWTYEFKDGSVRLAADWPAKSGTRHNCR